MRHTCMWMALESPVTVRHGGSTTTCCSGRLLTEVLVLERNQ